MKRPNDLVSTNLIPTWIGSRNKTGNITTNSKKKKKERFCYKGIPDDFSFDSVNMEELQSSIEWNPH